MIDQYVAQTEEGVLCTYKRFPVVLERGDGAYVYDIEEKKYLDFAAGYAVSSLGYNNLAFNTALKEQIDELIHTSNVYYHKVYGEAALALTRVSKMDKVFFTNSGTEAIEGALKAARKYAYTQKTGRYEFIAMENSFHGRSIGALSVTGNEAYRKPFEPLLKGVSFAKYNDIESVKALITKKTCAIILEPIQGEGGVIPIEQAFFEEVRTLCNQEGILLILDEIQCGMGRTGAMFAWQKLGVKPDIMAMAKAIGNGIPVGAFAMTNEVAEKSLVPGDHGTTFGGNPLACRAVVKVIEIFEQNKIVDHVNEVSAYLIEKLEEIVQTCEWATKRQGMGLMQGIIVTDTANIIIEKALERGLLLIGARQNVVRFVPPLIITKQHIDEMVAILKAI